MLELGIKILLSYLLGSVMGGALIARLTGGADLRTVGSGNLGATNALRTSGRGVALSVLVIDIAKGVLAVLWLPGAALPGIGLDANLPRDLVVYACGLGVIAGHVWPLWHEFRGGKGAATAMGVVVVLAPQLAPVLFGIWLLVIVLTGYVGLATMLTGLSAPLLVAGGYPVAGENLFWFVLPVALLLVYTHRRNIAAMRTGTENRLSRVMLLKRRQE